MRMSISIIKKPSALLPLAMAFAAFVLVIGHFAVYGNTHDPDEGAAAHVFQLLMVLQVPLVAFYTVKWLPRNPREVLLVLALLAALWVAAFSGVYFLT